MDNVNAHYHIVNKSEIENLITPHFFNLKLFNALTSKVMRNNITAWQMFSKQCIPSRGRMWSETPGTQVQHRPNGSCERQDFCGFTLSAPSISYGFARGF